MLEVLRKLLIKIVDDIDSGSCSMDESECMDVIKAVRFYTRKDGQWSKYQAYTFLNISRSKFDSLIREGKIPKGHKVPGFKELFWNEKDIRLLIKR